MSDQNKIQFESSVSSEGAESGFKRIGDAAGQMADRVEREVDKAGTAVSVIGSGAEKSADQFTRAEGRMAASIKRATTNLELLGKTASQKLEFQINERGLDAAKFEPMLAKMREIERQAQQASSVGSASLNKIGMSAAQTAAAMRSVPAQFTDIVVSLQSGQAPMTVLLQQGGQLKDMFGGVGSAAKALGGYVASLVTPFTVAAAAIGGIGYAAYAGSTEMDEFKKNLILTGNISGITADKFNAMAQSMANISGITRGAAAEALTAMAASGNIGAESIERLTRSALQFEKAGGPAVAETVKQFEALGKEPVKASVELSEKTHYLTLAVYEQIKSLEEQGKASEAAALAQKAWADAIDQRTPQMVQNLGYIESAWKGIKEAAAGAWDSAKSLGREETDLEKRVALLRKIGQANLDIESGSINSNRLKQQKEQWAQELKALVDSNNAKEAEAKKHAAEEAKNKAQIDAAVKYDKLIDDQASKAVKQRKEMQLLDADRAAGLVSEEKYQQAKAAIAKKYEEKGSSRPKVDKAALEAQREAERQQERLNGLLEVGSGVSKTYTADVALLGKALAGGKITTEQYSASASKLWLTQTEAGKAFKASSEAAKDAANAMTAWRSEHESQLAAIAEETSAVGQSAESRKIAIAGLQVEADAKKRIASLNDKLSAEARKSAEDEINTERDKQKAYVETALRKQQAVEGAYQLEQENRRFAADSILDERSRSQAILDIESETWRKRIELAEMGSDERKRLEGAFQQWYANQLSKPAIESMRKALEAIDQTFHDSFTRMLENGKADWDAFGKALATSFKSAVADEIYKLTIKPIVVSVVSSFAGGAAQAAGSVAGQSGSGIGGVVSGVTGAYNAVSGGITNAANSFAMSGFGQAAGLSTASVTTPTSFGSIVSPAGLTSAGSTFSAVAAPATAALIGEYLMAEMARAGWGMDNNRSAGGAYASNPYLYMAYQAGSRLFGRNRNISNDAAGIQGTFDISGFSGDAFQERSQKGGTFRSDKRWTDMSGVGVDVDRYLDGLLKTTVSGLQTIGKTLSVESTKALEGFSHEFRLQLTDNGDWSKAGEKIAAEISKVSDELVNRLVPTIGEFAQFGETATQTFQRLNQEVQATDAILLAMGKSASEAFGGVGLASIAAREDLIALAGGLEKLAGKTQSYYQAFYSADEQSQRAADQARGVLASGFADLGQAIPASKEAFRALVESQDLSSDSGRKLFNALLDLSDEFDTVTKASEAAADNLKKSEEKLKEATATAQKGQASLFDTFASDAQKLDAARKLVGDSFASIGSAVPASAAEFLKLAQSIDPATEAGQSFIATLGKVSNAFAYVQTAAVTAAEAAAAAIEKSRNTSAQAFFQQIDFSSSVDGYVNEGHAAIDKLFGNINAGAIESAQMAASAAADASQAWKSASQAIKSALDNIRTGGLSGLSPEGRYRLLKSQFDSTSAAAQSGDKEAAGKLGQIATDFLEASRDYNASSEAFQADRAAADTALSKSLSYASSQVSLQDTIAKASQASAAHLQSLNDTLTGFSAKALELLQKSYGGADRGTASNAVDKLAEAQASFDDWFKTTKAGDSKGYGNGTLTRLGDNFAQLTVGGNTWYVRAAESLLEVGKRIEAVRDQVKLDFGINLPSYAVGTPYVPEDQIAQIHQGEMIIPASAAAQLRKYGMGNQVDSGLQAEILAELRATRQGQQQSYSAMQQQLAASNSKLATVERRLAAMEDQARLQRAGS